MSLMAAAMRTESRSASRQLVALLTISFAGGTRRYSSNTLCSDTLGPFKGKILDAGEVPWGVPYDRSFAISPVEFNVTIEDTDDDFAKYVESSNGETLVISPPAVTYQIASPNVAIGSWFTIFTGVLTQWSFPAPGQVQFYLRTKTRLMDGPFLRVIAPGDFPYADVTAEGLVAPVIYGTHDSGGDQGAVPTLLVDISRNRYLVAAGYLKTVDRVYVGGAQVASGFSVAHPTINGKIYTTIDFTTPQTDDVTADVTGYDTNADGTGTLIDNPADALKHALVNWVFHSYASGAWFNDSTAPVDTTAFTTANAFCARYSHKLSRRYSSATLTGVDIVNEWGGSYQARPYWGNLGLLGVVFEDLDVPTLLIDDPYVKQGGDAGGSLPHVSCSEDIGIEHDTQDLISRVEIQYAYSESLGKYIYGAMVREGALSFGSPDSLALPCSYAGQ